MKMKSGITYFYAYDGSESKSTSLTGYIELMSFKEIMEYTGN